MYNATKSYKYVEDTKQRHTVPKFLREHDRQGKQSFSISVGRGNLESKHAFVIDPSPNGLDK